MFYIISCDKYVCEKSVHEKRHLFEFVFVFLLFFFFFFFFVFCCFFLKGDKYVCVLYIKLILNEFVTDR